MVGGVWTRVSFYSEQACPDFIIVISFFSSFPLHGGVRLLICLQGKLGTDDVWFTGSSCLCCQPTVVLSRTTSFFMLQGRDIFLFYTTTGEISCCLLLKMNWSHVTFIAVLSVFTGDALWKLYIQLCLQVLRAWVVWAGWHLLRI